jgi:hypothetical protein
MRSGRGDGTLGRRRSVPWDALSELLVTDVNRDSRPDPASLTGNRRGEVGASVVLNWTGRPAPPCVVVIVMRVRLRLATPTTPAATRPCPRPPLAQGPQEPRISQRPRYGAVRAKPRPRPSARQPRTPLDGARRRRSHPPGLAMPGDEQRVVDAFARYLATHGRLVTVEVAFCHLVAERMASDSSLRQRAGRRPSEPPSTRCTGRSRVACRSARNRSPGLRRWSIHTRREGSTARAASRVRALLRIEIFVSDDSGAASGPKPPGFASWREASGDLLARVAESRRAEDV